MGKKRFAYFWAVQKSLFAFSLVFVTSSSFADEPIDSLVKTTVDQFMESTRAPGVAVALYCKGPRLYNFGRANVYSGSLVQSDTIFEIASVSKIFASTLLGWEVSQGHVRLEDPIAHYLLELPRGTRRPVDRVTLKHLATHTAGFETEGASDSGLNNFQLMEGLTNWKPIYAIGTQKSYSNFGYGLLGQTLQDMSIRFYGSALSFEQLMNHIITAPLGMKDTSVAVPSDRMLRYAQGYNRKLAAAPRYLDHPVWPGGGGIRSTAADMMKFLEANLGITDAGAPLPLIHAMQVAQTPVHVGDSIVSALGWDVHPYGNQLITKNGSNKGFSSFIAFQPEARVGIVILVNRSASAPQEAAIQILRSLIESRSCN